MFEFWKRSGSAADVLKYREITCSDSASKPLTKPLRQSVVPILEQLAGVGQSGGGVRAGSTDVTRLWLSAASDHAVLSHLSHAFVFLDVRGAFASIERAFVFPTLDGA